MLFQDAFSGVMSPIIQKLQNKLHRVWKQQSVDRAPKRGGRRASALVQGAESQQFKLKL